jgi:hypothetical protein
MSMTMNNRNTVPQAAHNPMPQCISICIVGEPAIMALQRYIKFLNTLQYKVLNIHINLSQLLIIFAARKLMHNEEISDIPAYALACGCNGK